MYSAPSIAKTKDFKFLLIVEKNKCPPLLHKAEQSLTISEVLKDPDLFGGEEDRIPWVEKAFKNSETN